MAVPVMDSVYPLVMGHESPVRRVYPMLSSVRHLPIALLLGLAVLTAEPARAAAGWMGFRNDTGVNLVLQETVGARPSRPLKLFANETVRDTPPSQGGTRVFAIFDPAHRDKPLYKGQFRAPAGDENILYVIKSDGKGGLLIETVRVPMTNGLMKKLPGKR